MGRCVLLQDRPVSIPLQRLKARWLLFMHTADIAPLDADDYGLIRHSPGEGRLHEHVANYVIQYADGSETRQKILRRYQLGMFRRPWGENCFHAVPHEKPFPVNRIGDQPDGNVAQIFGMAETMVVYRDLGLWTNWIWAWKNPHPGKVLKNIRLEPITGKVVVSAISIGRTATLPLRWERRQKALLRLPKGSTFDKTRDEVGQVKQVQLDLGQVISLQPRTLYSDRDWSQTRHNLVPEVASRELIVEYTAHRL